MKMSNIICNINLLYCLEVWSVQEFNINILYEKIKFFNVLLAGYYFCSSCMHVSCISAISDETVTKV